MANKVDCICQVLEPIDEFFSISEFERFQEYLNGLIASGELREVPVKQKYAGFTEQWFRCKHCSGVWRLVHPDFPFKGIWEKV